MKSTGSGLTDCQGYNQGLAPCKGIRIPESRNFLPVLHRSTSAPVLQLTVHVSLSINESTANR